MTDTGSLIIRRRAVWTSDAGECAVCGAEFPLVKRHYVLRCDEYDTSRGEDLRLCCSWRCAASYRINNK